MGCNNPDCILKETSYSQHTQEPLFTGRRGATFSDADPEGGRRPYHYDLWRSWGHGKPSILWIMLNPSTADSFWNDPTVERCQRRSNRWAYQTMVVCNIFAYRATDPSEMKAQQDPVGPDNDETILRHAREAERIICGWGTHGKHRGRQKKVLELLKEFDLHVLDLNEGGTPRHPLYVPYSKEPMLWKEEDA